MKDFFTHKWTAATATERRILVWGLWLLPALLYLWLVWAAGAARSSLQDSVLQLRSQAAELELNATAVEQLRSLPQVPVSNASLPVQLQTAATALGLAANQILVQALDGERSTASAAALPFTTWLQWLEALQQQNIRVESLRIEAAGSTGMVSAAATLVRPAAP